MDRLSDYQLVLQIQIREIEACFSSIHEDLIDWGRWGRGWDRDKPRLAPDAVWSLPGDPDPDRDMDSPPERVGPPINERMVIKLDERINDQDGFPAVWRKVLRINYVGAKRKNGSYCVLPEWQRHDEARMSSESYRHQLAQALRHLSEPRQSQYVGLRA